MSKNRKRKSALINATTQSNKADVKDIKNSTINIVLLNIGNNEEINANIPEKVTSLEDFRKLLLPNIDSYANLTGEYHEEINQGRDLINSYKVQTALDFLCFNHEFVLNSCIRFVTSLILICKASKSAIVIGFRK